MDSSTTADGDSELPTLPLEEAWDQVKAGVYLIDWSRLADFNVAQLEFDAPKDDGRFESEEHGHHQIAPVFGRLICWIAFSVGSEYLMKGCCVLKRKLHPNKKNEVIRHPNQNEEFDSWITKVTEKDGVVDCKKDGLGTLGDAPVESIKGLNADDQPIVLAARNFLAKSIRNRDAHRYAQNKRTQDYWAVPKLFIPAHNALLRCLDQDILRDRLHSLKFVERQRII